MNYENQLCEKGLIGDFKAFLMRERHRPIFSFHFHQHQDVIRVSFLLFVENDARRGPKRLQYTYYNNTGCHFYD